MSVDLESIRFLGHGLRRPECVVAHRSGLLLVPDWTPPGGISVIDPSGRTHRILATQAEDGVDLPVRANGIALEPGGTVLIAHLGETAGAIYRLHPDGRCTVVTDTIDGAPMPPANFVAVDGLGRLWITISTTRVPRALDYRPDAASGVIALHDAAGTRAVATGLGYTNECLLSEDEATLWVNETFARRLTGYPIAGGALGAPETLARFGPGIFPDGLAEATDGSLLVTSIVSNTVLRVAPDGTTETLLTDHDPDHVAWVEAAFQAGEMGRPHLDGIKAGRLRNISNLAFGGPDLGTAYLGCLLGEAVAAVDLGLAGRALRHWDADLGALAAHLEEAP